MFGSVNFLVEVENHGGVRGTMSVEVRARWVDEVGDGWEGSCSYELGTVGGSSCGSASAERIVS
jgi:hypothetical protein